MSHVKKAVAWVAASAVALSLAACSNGETEESGTATEGTSEATTEEETSEGEGEAEALSGNLLGGGASAQQQAMDAWKAGFTSVQPDVTVDYDVVGSGAGITGLTSGKYSWAGSDAHLQGDEVAAVAETCGSEAWNLPVYISPVAVVFNLEGVDSLNLKANTIASIFRGDITNWNDPAIAEDNPDATLPDLAITPVHRGDESGTTENFTDYLHAAAPDVWTDEPAKTWPVQGGESGDKTAGLIQTVKNGNGTIGYADASQATELGTVALEAADGTFVQFSNETAANAAETATPAEGATGNNLALQVNRVPEDNQSYPLILISYSIVCSQYSDPEVASLVKAFVGYEASAEGQEAAAQAAGSAPLSDTLREKVLTAVDAIQ